MKDPLRGLLPVELMTEHAVLDAEHDAIFCRIELLKESALASAVVPHAELLSLADSFAAHFASEEGLAREAGIDFSAHLREHAQALRLLGKARDDLQGGRFDLRTFLRYLEYWFEQHIKKFDKPFGKRLSTASPSLPASHARGARTPGAPGATASAVVLFPAHGFERSA